MLFALAASVVGDAYPFGETPGLANDDIWIRRGQMTGRCGSDADSSGWSALERHVF